MNVLEKRRAFLTQSAFPTVKVYHPVGKDIRDSVSRDALKLSVGTGEARRVLSFTDIKDMSLRAKIDRNITRALSDTDWCVVAGERPPKLRVSVDRDAGVRFTVTRDNVKPGVAEHGSDALFLVGSKVSGTRLAATAVSIKQATETCGMTPDEAAEFLIKLPEAEFTDLIERARRQLSKAPMRVRNQVDTIKSDVFEYVRWVHGEAKRIIEEQEATV